MAPGMQALDDEMKYLAAEYEYRCLVGYNGPPNRKWALQGAIARAQARVDAALASVVPDDKLLDARLLELTNVLDGTIDPVEYMRPCPPAPTRPTWGNDSEFNRLVQHMTELTRGDKS